MQIKNIENELPPTYSSYLSLYLHIKNENDDNSLLKHTTQVRIVDENDNPILAIYRNSISFIKEKVFNEMTDNLFTVEEANEISTLRYILFKNGGYLIKIY